jgi:hypothetical protein
VDILAESTLYSQSLNLVSLARLTHKVGRAREQHTMTYKIDGVEIQTTPVRRLKVNRYKKFDLHSVALGLAMGIVLSGTLIQLAYAN